MFGWMRGMLVYDNFLSPNVYSTKILKSGLSVVILILFFPLDS